MECFSLDEIKDIELDLLIQFDNFCKENNLKYALTYGTLLGAIRHNDFIPWDDDVDVMMPRKDFEILKELLNSGKKSIAEYISFLSSEQDDYYYHFNKIYNNKTIAKMDNNITKHGIWLDIFPVDSMPKSKLMSKWFHIKARTLRNMIIAGTTDFNASNVNKVMSKKILSRISKIIGLKRIVVYLNKYVQKYNKRNEGVVSIVHGQYSVEADLHYEEYFDTELHIFRDHYFEIPKGWDKILKGMYGEYMMIPSKENQSTHYINAKYKEVKNEEI